MQGDPTWYKSYMLKAEVTKQFDRQVNSTGYKSDKEESNSVHKFDRQVNSTWYKSALLNIKN